MSFDVNKFRAKLEKGGARSSLFRVVLVSAPWVGLDSEEFSFMCKAASIPASTIGTIEAAYFGRRIKLPGDRTFEPWNATVINDETFDLRSAFERWMDGMDSHSRLLGSQTTRGALSNPYSYVGTARVEQLSKEGKVIKGYQIINLFPTQLGEIALAWENSDQIEEFDVTFEYDYWMSTSTS